MHHGLPLLRGAHAYCTASHERQRGDRFGRMFPELPSLYIDPHVLTTIGMVGGGMDGGTAADRTQTVDVGMVFFGQFVDHDITLDVSSSLGRVTTPEMVENVRTPTLDLDCIYGTGPEAQPYLYHHGATTDPFNGAKLLTGDAGDPLTEADLPRSSAGRAIIGDHRNDENRVISQMQLAMIRAHNAICDVLHTADNTVKTSALFEEARRLLTWHYQWVVINDFLPAMCGRMVVDDILANGRRVYCPDPCDPFIPVEFSVAAYRFGHSMAPQTIQVQQSGPSHDLFGTVLGGGFRPLDDSDAIVDWRELFSIDAGHTAQKAEKLDTKLASILLNLPFITEGETSLATRNLLRGQGFLLPSGEQVAERLGRPTAEIDDVASAANAVAGGDVTVERALAAGTPLWLYLLAEAEHVGKDSDPGEGLGPVGARLVAEVVIGLMEADPRSFLGSNRAWHPADESIAANPITTVGDLLFFGSPTTP